MFVGQTPFFYEEINSLTLLFPSRDSEILILINCSEITINQKFYKYFIKNKKRGPEDEKALLYNNNLLLGFHRLAINGTDSKSSQPLYHKNLIITIKPISKIKNNTANKLKYLSINFSIDWPNIFNKNASK